MTKLLRIEAPHFVAGAVWEKREGRWYCSHSAPILRYMVGMSARHVKGYLDKKGWSYQWL